MTSLPRLADFVQPNLPESRLAAQWQKIAQVSNRPMWTGARSLTLAWSVAAVCLVGALTLLWSAPNAAPFHALSVERDQSGRELLRFPEGIVMVAPTQGRWSIEERRPELVRFSLESGEASFDVTPNQARRVLVSTPRCEVEVVGTSFEISVQGEARESFVRVTVHRGTVRVKGQTGEASPTKLLSGGESWTLGTPPEAPASAPLAVAASASVPTATAAAPLPAPRDPKRAFLEAERARLDGKPQEAERLFEQFRRDFPGDPRLGLVAFELGRLRMDVLGNSAAAITALDEAIRRAPNADFREDAEARLVQIFGGYPDKSRCKKARDDYLTRYPNGRHAPATRKACGP